ANFGWSRFEGPLLYNPRVRLNRGTVVKPVYGYTHANGACGVIGGYVYRGSRVPSLRGRYVFGELCTSAIWSLKLVNGRLPGRPGLFDPASNPSSFGEEPNRELSCPNPPPTPVQPLPSL